MSAPTPPSAPLTPPTAFSATPSGLNASSSPLPFVKVYCGNDECVPLSKQCTGGVFQGVLSDLATRISKREAQIHGNRSHRGRTGRNAAAVDRAASYARTVARSGGRDGKGESAPPDAEDCVGTSGLRGRVVKGGGTDAKKKRSTPLPAPTEAALASPSTEPSQMTDSSPTTDAAAAPVGEPLVPQSGARLACNVVYRRAELLPLSFVRDVTSNSKVAALYKQHLQLQEELQRHQLEQQQEENDDAASAFAYKASKNDAADATNTKSPVGRTGGKGGAASSSKAAPRRRGMPSGSRGGTTVSGHHGSCSASSAATSAVSSAALAAQIRTQLWTALRSTIPFFGVLTMPIHAPVESLLGLPASASASGASTAAARTATATTTTPPTAGVWPTATAACSGSYVLLGCRERPREETISADATPAASQAGQCASNALCSIGGVAACPSIFAVERLVEKAHGASVTRLPLLSSDAELRRSSGPSALVANGEGAKRSPRKQRLHPKEAQGQMPQQSLPPRCTLHPTTNRVVLMPPPLPEDIAAGYGAARLMTKALGESAADHSEGADASTTQSGTCIDRIATHDSSRGHPDRGYGHFLDKDTNSFVSAVNTSVDDGLRHTQTSDKDTSSTPLAKSSTDATLLSDTVGVEGNEEATLTSAHEPLNVDPASQGPNAASSMLHAGSAVRPSGSTQKGGSGSEKGMEPAIPLSLCAIARLTPSTRFTVQLSSCTVTLTTQTRKGAGTTGAEVPCFNTTGAASNLPGAGVGATGSGEMDGYADELSFVFDGLDVLWHGPNGEEALLQWVLDEYSILLKQRLAAAMAQWTSLVHAGDTSGGATDGSSSKVSKGRRHPPSEHVHA